MEGGSREGGGKEEGGREGRGKEEGGREEGGSTCLSILRISRTTVINTLPY